MNSTTSVPVSLHRGKRIGRIVIVGVSGYMGSALAVGLKNDFEVYGIYNTHITRIDGVAATKIDIFSSNDILEFLTQIEPDCIIYAVDVNYDRSSENPQGAELIHFKVPSLFFKIYRKPHTFIYLSKDYVYGQEQYPAGKTKFTEKDSAVPKSVYSTTKMSGEGVVLGNGFNCFVFRIAKVYGEAMGGVYKVRRNWVNEIHSHFEKRKSFKAYSDQFHNFVYIGDVVRAFRKFLLAPPKDASLYHLAAPGEAISRLELATLYAQKFSFDPSLIEAVESAQDKNISHLRPRQCALDSSKFERDFDFKFQSPEEGLGELLERMKKGYSRYWI